MDTVSIVVKPRDVTGSRAARRLRRAGLIPGVVYGHGQDATLFSVEPHALRDALTTDAGTHAVLDLSVEGDKRVYKAIVKDLERAPVKNNVIHIDLQEIRLDETIESQVAIHFEGESAAVKAGGVFDANTREVTVRGLVTAIPEHLVLDVSGLELTDTLTVADLVIAEGLEILNDPEEVLCSVLPPRKEEEAVEGAEGAEAAEPQVVGKSGEAAAE